MLPQDAPFTSRMSCSAICRTRLSLSTWIHWSQSLLVPMMSLTGMIGIANTPKFVAGTPRMSLFIGGSSTWIGTQKMNYARMQKKRVESQRTFERWILRSMLLKQTRSAKKNKKKQKNHAKHRRPIAPRIKILKRQRTARPPAEEAGDVADAQCEGIPSSSHSWMPSDVPEVDEATPSSPHSWMHSPEES